MAIDFPATPTLNQQFSAAGSSWVFDGTAWNIVPQMVPAVASDTPPANPAVGQFWWRASNGQLYLYYDDGNSKQWVQAAPAATNTAASLIRLQKFTASGTYTPHPNMLYCIIECVGGGGAGGGVVAVAAKQATASGGGGGGYSRKYATRALIGASQAVTVGAGGTSPGVANGNPGGGSSLGALCSAFGGAGGPVAQSGVGVSTGGAGGGFGAGDFGFQGGDGGGGQGEVQIFLFCGTGGSSHFAGRRSVTALNADGATGYPYGGGGTGACSLGSVNYAGGYGAAGVVLIQEFCSS